MRVYKLCRATRFSRDRQTDVSLNAASDGGSEHSDNPPQYNTQAAQVATVSLERRRQTPTQRALWRQFLPLSLSDVVMALGDPLITTGLARLPDARTNIAAAGMAKTLAVVFESPIIMVLHASNRLAATVASRRAMLRFTLWAVALLTVLLAGLALPPVFDRVAPHLLGAEATALATARSMLPVLVLWPAAIGLRRYYQGLLIHAGQAVAIGRSGVLRLATMAMVVAIGVYWHMPGWLMAALALIGGVVVEATLIAVAATATGATQPPRGGVAVALPSDMTSVWRFYRPLASSMLVVWGARALLLGIVARAADGPVAMAAWPAAWGLIVVVANATRMVQQVVIHNHATCDGKTLLRFVVTVGAVCSLVLVGVAYGPFGTDLLAAFVGHDAALVDAVQPVMAFGVVVPMLVAVQNALQGVLIASAQTRRVNAATWLGAIMLLCAAAIATHAGIGGAVSAVVAMIGGLLVEIAWLALGAVRDRVG